MYLPNESTVCVSVWLCMFVCVSGMCVGVGVLEVMRKILHKVLSCICLHIQ